MSQDPFERPAALPDHFGFPRGAVDDRGSLEVAELTLGAALGALRAAVRTASDAGASKGAD